MEIATIGFTKSSAEHFFNRIAQSAARTLVDVRLNNTSQLAGFAKKSDLPFLLKRICGVDYVEEPALAPEQRLLRGYRAKDLSWDEYSVRYIELLRERRVESVIDPTSFETGAILLCSEAVADQCHRRLAAEYLANRWPNVRIVHL